MRSRRGLQSPEKSVNLGSVHADGKSTLQQDSGLLRIKIGRCNGPFVVAGADESVHGAGREDHGDVSVVVDFLSDKSTSGSPTTSTGSSEHNAFGTGVGRRADEVRVAVLVTKEDIDVRKRGQVQAREIESGLGSGHSSAVVEVRQLVEEEAEVALLFSAEGVESIGVVLDNVKGRGDAVVKGDHGATVLGKRRDSQCHGLVEVQRTVGGNGSRGPHGTYYNNGLGGGDGQVEEESSLLECVSSVSYDNTLGSVLGQILGDAAVELEEDGCIDVATVNVGDLVTEDIGDACEQRDSINQSLDGDCSRCVASSLHTRATSAGNSATLWYC